MNKNLKENVKHGTLQFPFALYTHNRSCEELLVPHHWHEEIEIIFIEEGSFEFEINMEKIEGKKNTFYFINKEEIHYMHSKPTLIQYGIVFDLSILSFEVFDSSQENIIKPLLTGQLKFPREIELSTSYGKEIYKEFEEIKNSYKRQEPGFHINIKGALLKIIAILVKNNLFIKIDSYKENNNDYKINIIKNVFTYMEENYKNKIYIKELAEIANMNEQYFCRFFKKSIGKTITEYLNQYRIEKSIELLKKKDMKIVDISLECGYDNIGYFIKKFKEYKGHKPSDYRKQNIR